MLRVVHLVRLRDLLRDLLRAVLEGEVRQRRLAIRWVAMRWHNHPPRTVPMCTMCTMCTMGPMPRMVSTHRTGVVRNMTYRRPRGVGGGATRWACNASAVGEE